MDIFVDPEGVVMVRNCGCGKHGLTSFWTEHDEKWQKKNRAEAEVIVSGHENRFGKHGRFDEARRMIAKRSADA